MYLDAYKKFISIHAPLSGERLISTTRRTNRIDFNPRSPKRGATSHLNTLILSYEFQSTLP